MTQLEQTVRIYLNEKDIAAPENGYSHVDNLTPIPLTEEWLLKFGFVKNLTGFYEKGRLTYRPDYGWQILSQWVKDWVGVAPILYVHQLQNLFYSLCGEELNICK